MAANLLETQTIIIIIIVVDEVVEVVVVVVVIKCVYVRIFNFVHLSCEHGCRSPRVRRMWSVRHVRRVIIALLVVVVVDLLLRPSSTSSSPASIFVDGVGGRVDCC